jgi:AP-1 complex subunit mu
LDVYEKVNIILNQQGQLIKSEILGTLKMKTYLTGMPELKLGLNDKMIYDDQNKKSQSRTIEL